MIFLKKYFKMIILINANQNLIFIKIHLEFFYFETFELLEDLGSSMFEYLSLSRIWAHPYFEWAHLYLREIEIETSL